MLIVDGGTRIMDQTIILELNEGLRIVINTPHTPNYKSFSFVLSQNCLTSTKFVEKFSNIYSIK